MATSPVSGSASTYRPSTQQGRSSASAGSPRASRQARSEQAQRRLRTLLQRGRVPNIVEQVACFARACAAAPRVATAYGIRERTLRLKLVLAPPQLGHDLDRVRFANGGVDRRVLECQRALAVRKSAYANTHEQVVALEQGGQ